MAASRVGSQVKVVRAVLDMKEQDPAITTITQESGHLTGHTGRGARGAELVAEWGGNAVFVHTGDGIGVRLARLPAGASIADKLAHHTRLQKAISEHGMQDRFVKMVAPPTQFPPDYAWQAMEVWGVNANVAAMDKQEHSAVAVWLIDYATDDRMVTSESYPVSPDVKLDNIAIKDGVPKFIDLDGFEPANFNGGVNAGTFMAIDMQFYIERTHELFNKWSHHETAVRAITLYRKYLTFVACVATIAMLLKRDPVDNTFDTPAVPDAINTLVYSTLVPERDMRKRSKQLPRRRATETLLVAIDSQALFDMDARLWPLVRAEAAAHYNAQLAPIFRYFAAFTDTAAR